MSGRAPHVVIVVANAPGDEDNRVRRQCQALESAGYQVTVISPRGRSDRVPGTRRTTIRSYRLPVSGAGLVSFAAEFGWSFLAVARHLLPMLVRGRADAVQVCNPPDVFWPLALVSRAFGRPFVFDHHDLSPEVYQARTGRPNRVVWRVLRILEWLSMRCASAVISTNESYRRIAIERGGCRPERVVVVRNGPPLAEVRGTTGGATGSGHRIVYLGVIGPQDGVAAAVLAADDLARRRGRDDWRLVIAGDGESLPGLRRLVAERRLTDLVEFTGWLNPAGVDRVLSGATVAVQPDPRTRHAEFSTMAKTVEYLARGVPVVAVDLTETRASAGPAAVYLPNGTPEQFAEAIDDLLDDPARRERMSHQARRRYAETLAWEHQAAAYLALWKRLLGPAAAPGASDSRPTEPTEAVQPHTP